MLYANSREYKKALDILADSSQHIMLIAQAIKNQILPKLANKNSMIDVGAGIGTLTQHLESEFKEVMVLDINPDVENELKSHNYEVKIGDFFQFETDRKFDLVLCSHVMYHFDEKQMKDFIAKLQFLLNPGGYCFIALIAPRGKNHHFHVKINPHYINSEHIIRILEKERLVFERVEAIPHHLKTKNAGEMRSLLKFFLIENCLSQSSSLLRNDELQKINAVIEEEIVKCKIPESNEYDFEQEDDYILIPKLIS